MPQPYDVLLFTDGACSGNPGPGGWAFILRHLATGLEKRQSGGHRDTTNNRMELTAVLEGLRALKTAPLRVQVVTDSQYVSRGMTEWLPGWLRNDWRRGPKGKAGEVKNADLWKTLVALRDKHHVDFVYVAGHAGHPENEECDRMAVEATRQAAQGR
ncbi:MAG TPA: ribonuclease HI [Phycisphaerae bacterium]|nr:ribonuclease HI [Phycisphaerae bacterium]